MSIDDSFNYTHCMIDSDILTTTKNRGRLIHQFVGPMKGTEIFNYIKRTR